MAGHLVVGEETTVRRPSRVAWYIGESRNAAVRPRRHVDWSSPSCWSSNVCAQSGRGISGFDERAQPAATAVATIADPIVRANARQILDAMGRSPRPPETFLVERVIDPSCRRVGCGMAVDDSLRHAGNSAVTGAQPRPPASHLERSPSCAAV
jgi:hypothetical protein